MAGMLLVRNHFSVISPGTEGSTVQTARKSLIGKARERPQQAKLVIDSLKKQGPVQTYRAVMKKLDAYSPMGYSCAGEVMELGEGAHGFAVGDKVACAGAGYASHAEVVSVPVNLCVKLPKDANLKHAAYNTLGAIALQGIRQADLRLGESCAVIGLGLLGQLTCLMLKAGGVHAYGIDIDAGAVDLARQRSAEQAWARSTPGIADRIEALTGALGVDATIIAAGTDSLDPVNFAGQITRKKGRVVVVGAVPTGFDRDPHYYRKELDLRMSCSYGPGRYDPAYEEKGMDFPAAYVRWTENRNMQAFQELVHGGRIDLDYLTTHEFALEKAPDAYEMILGRSEPFLGIVLKYDVEKPVVRQRVTVRESSRTGKVSIAFIGAGSYAMGSLLPNLPNDPQAVRKGIMARSGTTSKRAAERFGFEFCTSEVADLLDNDQINTVFITTRHDSHAAYVQQSLEAGKHTFVEKPLCLRVAELDQIERAYSSGPETQLMVGFNRRFAPLAVRLKERLGGGPVSMTYRINAGSIPADSWVQDPAVGGGRIVGEACHFIDFLTFISGAVPTRVHALALPDPHNLNDTVTINLEFADGSIGSVGYFANGAKTLPKERVEVFGSGMVGIIDDFKELAVFSDGKPFRKKLISQNKGQAAMVGRFVESVKAGGAPVIPAEELFAVTRSAFSVIESLQSGRAVSVANS